jgi:putative SOS response-associated peptidase YedK
MCGRFSLAYQKTDREYDEYFKAIMQAQKKAKPRYNIAPTQTSPIIRVRDGEPVCEEVRWGLYENWWTDVLEIEGIRTNARSEKSFTGGLFKNSARKRRCVVLASGWYEWKQVEGRKRKKPGEPGFNFCMKDHSIMMFAGIWATEYLAKDEKRDNYAIITTDGNEIAKPIHDRMPVILNVAQAKAWLDPDYKDLAKLEGFLVPYKGRDLTTYQVGPLVNSVKNIGEECLAPLQ